MAYRIYLDGVLFPVPPSKITMKINGNNETVTLINEGEANILKSPALTELEFELPLPNVKYPFAVYPDGFRPAKFYMDKLEELMRGKASFQYIMTRTTPAGQMIFDTNLTVSLENYSIEEDAGDGMDVTAKVSLKQYKEFVTKTCEIDLSLISPEASMDSTRAVSSNAPPGGSYQVVKGDCLSSIAKRFYGKASKWTVIYEANKGVIGGNPNLIYPGQVLTIP